MTERHAYKLKKPMLQWPLDYRSVQRRRRGCERELQLNRRLAPAVYLAVVPLVRNRRGALELAGRGRPVDWLVKMRRLPAARMLDGAIERGRVDDADLGRVAALLARFYAQARPLGLSGPAYARRLRRRIRANRRALVARDLALDAGLVEEIAATQMRFVDRAPGLIASRAHKVVEGHGDLRPEHVALTVPPCIIDCLEFSRDLRGFDPYEELAFLASECRLRGAPAVARRLITKFRQASGDRVPVALLRFYMSQRASSRAKIKAWHLRDPCYADPDRSRAQAHMYLAEAMRQARLALAALRSFVERPAIEQGRDRLPAPHARERRAEQRRDRQHDQLALG
jgi:aminoglycoside phosphotransferase family enzyme